MPPSCVHSFTKEAAARRAVHTLRWKCLHVMDSNSFTIAVHDGASCTCSLVDALLFLVKFLQCNIFIHHAILHERALPHIITSPTAPFSSSRCFFSPLHGYPFAARRILATATAGWAHTIQATRQGAIFLQHDPVKLPFTTRWLVHDGSHSALGMALPGTAGPEGKAAEARKGNVQRLAPQESVQYNVRVGVAEDVAAYRDKIARVMQQR